MTTLYIAWSSIGEQAGVFDRAGTEGIACLVSYAFMREFERTSARRPWRQLMLDSGAYSVWSRGEEIDYAAYLAVTREARWHECVSLDVIGDPNGSRVNAHRMLRDGSPAYPVFHYGEPWWLLREYCELFPKIGLSCRFGESVEDSWRWLERCFWQQWPHRFHSFGYVDKRVLRAFPFHSADASTWSAGSRYGHWNNAFDTRMRLGGKDGYDGLVAELRAWLQLERELKSRWRREMRRWETDAGHQPTDAAPGRGATATA